MGLGQMVEHVQFGFETDSEITIAYTVDFTAPNCMHTLLSDINVSNTCHKFMYPYESYISDLSKTVYFDYVIAPRNPDSERRGSASIQFSVGV